MKSPPLPILISGFIGAGKSTLAQHLAKTYRWKYISGAKVFREVAKKQNALDKSYREKKGFWESPEGKKLLARRKHDKKIDIVMDKLLVKKIRKNPRCISDARMMPWLYKGKAIRIWLSVTPPESIRRVAKRDGMSRKEVRNKVLGRYAVERKIYSELYGVVMGKDFSPFDLVLNNEYLTPQQTYRIVHQFIQSRRKALGK